MRTGYLVLRTASVLLAVALAGCASHRDFREGQRLLADGRIEEALPRLQAAALAEPRNAEYRVAFLETRERAIRDLLDRASKAVDAGKQDDAMRLYQRVHSLSPGHAVARGGIAGIERDRRHADLMKEARSALSRGDTEAAHLRLRQILSENPDHADARSLQRTIADASARAAAPAQMSAALRKPITIEFKDAPLRQVFEVLARTSGLNFVFDREVRTDLKTTVFLRNVTVDVAINLVLLTNQLEQRWVDVNTIIIYPNTPAKAREYQQLTVKSFVLATADARVVANTIRTIVKTRDVIVDEKMNMIIVRDSPEAVRMAERLVALHDAPEPEVMLEVEILEVKRSRLLELGVRWPGQLSLTPLPSTAGGTLTLNNLRNLNGDRVGATIDSAAIQARQTDSDSNLLANPRIRARNREKARILIGDRLPTITSTSTATGFVSESINYIDVGLKLEVEPTIYADSEVAIKVGLEVSNIVSQIQTRSGTLAYQLGTRSASTTLRLKDGENQVLAGLIQDNDRTSANRVPGLGSVPLLGRLFGAQSDDNAKTEIVLSITPRLVRGVQRPDAVLAEFDAGTEASLRNRIGDSGAAAAPPQPPPTSTAPRTEPRPGTSTPASPSTSPAPPGQGATAPTATTSTLTGIAPTPAGSGGSTPPGTQSPPIQLLWQGPTSIRRGDVFALQLAARTELAVASFPTTIVFDPKILQVVGVSEGDFLQQGGAQTTFSSRVDPSGRIVVALARAAGGSQGQGGIVTVSFRATAATDETRVEVASAAATAPGGTPLVQALPSPFAIRIGP